MQGIAGYKKIKFENKNPDTCGGQRENNLK